MAARLVKLDSVPDLVDQVYAAIAAAIATGDGARTARLIEQHGQRASGNLAEQLTQMLNQAVAQGDRR